MKKTAFLSIISATILVFNFSSCKKTEEKPPQEPMSVTVAYPQVDSVLLRKTFSGTLTANTEVPLEATVSGKLISHPYSPGDFVKKGTVLFEIDKSTYENSLKEAQGQLDNAKASYQLASTQYQARKAAYELDDAVSEMEVLQSKALMEEAEAQIKSYEAELQQARENLEKCVIKAPCDGRVTRWEYDEGKYIPGSMESPVTLATIYDDSKVLANIRIDENSYIDITRNHGKGLDLNKMPVKFDQALGREYTASLEYVAPNIDKSTGTMLLKAEIDNPDGELKSGMYMTLELPYDTMDEAIIIEDKAIGTDQIGKYVYTVDDNDCIVTTHIETGDLVPGDATKRIVLKGLNAKSRYVTEALLKVRAGEKIKPVVSNR